MEFFCSALNTRWCPLLYYFLIYYKRLRFRVYFGISKSVRHKGEFRGSIQDDEDPKMSWSYAVVLDSPLGSPSSSSTVQGLLVFRDPHGP